MTQTKLKVISILLLIVLALFSVTLFATKITITSKGIATVKYDAGTKIVTYYCDPQNSNECSITIDYSTP